MQGADCVAGRRRPGRTSGCYAAASRGCREGPRLPDRRRFWLGRLGEGAGLPAGSLDLREGDEPMSLGATFGKNKQDNSGSFTGTDNYSGTTDFTQSPTNPQWVTDAAQGFVFGGTALAGRSPPSYVAGPTPLLQTAASIAGDLNGTPWAYN